MPILMEDAIKQTQITLKPIFSKPKCTTKLLTKPPFRFIHDIVTATKAVTGFPKNYFSSHELGSKNLKDKASKVAFLDKLIYLVGVCHGKEIDVRPSKVVAGLEPINTNILLTLFGKAAVDPNLDHNAAIKHCQFGGEIGEFSRVRKSPPRENEDEEEKSGLGEEAANDVDDKDVPKNRVSSAIEGTETIEVNEDTPPALSERMSETKDDNEIAVSSQEEKEKRQRTLIPSLEDRIRQCNRDPITTKQIIGSIVAKPKCTEKLLKKPPFRFLHDLIMAVNKAAGLGLEDIYTDEEMDSSNVKNKDAKIQFLEKICNYVSDQLNVTVDIKPSKVVAGLDAAKTSHFLQLLAVVALNEQRNGPRREANSPNRQAENKASREILSESKEEDTNDSVVGNFPPAKIHEGKKSKDNSAEQEDEMKEEYTCVVEKDIHDCTDEDQGERSEPTPLSNSDKSFGSTGDKETEQHSKEEEAFPISRRVEIENQNDYDQSEEKNEKSGMLASTLEMDGDPTEHKKDEVIEEKKTSIEQLFFGTDEFQEETIADEAKQNIRPKTARRRPPRIKERTSSAEKKSIVKVERPTIFKDEDGEQFDKETITNTKKMKILDNDREDKEVSESNNDNNMRLRLQVRKRPGDHGNTSSLDTRRTKATPYDLQAMSQSIQRIARAATPIGRVMDYLPTEINAMMKEREHWRDEYERQEKELAKMKKKTEMELEPLQSQMRSIEDEIEHMKDLLFKKKVQIGQNEEWIKGHIRRICQM